MNYINYSNPEGQDIPLPPDPVPQTITTYSISGSTGIGGVTLNYTGGPTNTDDSGAYSIIVPYGWSGTITPSLSGYYFYPENKNYVNVQADQTDQNFTSTGITFIISGNAGVGGATLRYTDGTPKTAISDASGNYSFTVPYSWSGTVTPSKTGLTFSPVNRSYTNIQSNQTDQNFTALVTISGNTGTNGVTINYSVDGIAKSVISDAKGNYSISVPYGWTGTVTPIKICGGRNSLTRCYFMPAMKSYTNVTVNQKAQNYTLKRVY